MDQNNIENLYETINVSTDERKILYESVLKNEEKVNSTQDERYRLMLTQNFLKLEILDAAECYNMFVEFINSIYVLKSSDDRDNQEILTWLLSQKSKATELLQNLIGAVRQSEEELQKLNSQNQLFQCNKQQIAININDIKAMLDQTHLKIKETENARKVLDEKLVVLKQHRQGLLSNTQELTELLNQKTIEIENYEKNFDENNTAAKLSLTTEYKLKADAVRSEYLKMEKKWKCERINFQMKEEELIKTRKDREFQLQQELDVLKRDCDALYHEFNGITNDIQILHRKKNEMNNLEKMFENDETELKTRQKIIENQVNRKKLNNLNNMKKLRESRAEERNNLKMKYNKLCLEQELLKKQTTQRTAVSSSQVTSSSSVHFNDYIFDLSSDERDIEVGKKLVDKKQ